MDKPLVALKTCTLCKENKLLSEYDKSDRAKSGYKSRCKQCIADTKQIKSMKKELDSNTEQKANESAIRRLIKNHSSEFLTLVTQERMALSRK